MPHTIFIILVAIVLFGYFLERLLTYLNSTCWSDKLPAELEGIYDAEKYKKQQDYEKVNHRFGLLTSTVNLVVVLLMLFLGGFAWVDNLSASISNQPILNALIFFGILMLASDLIGTPFEIYDTFVIEEKFGFNKTTVKTFIFDKLKGWLLSALIGGVLLALIVWFYLNTTNLFWVYAWIVVSLFMIFMAMFYSTLIVPLFNKQTPLEGGELRDAIEAFSKKTGFKLDNIFVIDGSKRSSKANAYFSGLGKKKRIVLYDTLIKDLATNEIVSVLAHEIGHYKKKHILSGVFISILQTGFTLFILSLFIGNPDLSAALGAIHPSFQIGLIAFGMLYSPISLILGLGTNVWSRKNEYEADSFAGEYSDAAALISGLKKLSVNTLSNLTPHPVYVFFYYSHPTLLQRIHNLASKIK